MPFSGKIIYNKNNVFRAQKHNISLFRCAGSNAAFFFSNVLPNISPSLDIHQKNIYFNFTAKLMFKLCYHNLQGDNCCQLRTVSSVTKELLQKYYFLNISEIVCSKYTSIDSI